MKQPKIRRDDLPADVIISRMEPTVRLGHGDDKPKKDENLPPAS